MRVLLGWERSIRWRSVVRSPNPPAFVTTTSPSCRLRRRADRDALDRRVRRRAPGGAEGVKDGRAPSPPTRTRTPCSPRSSSGRRLTREVAGPLLSRTVHALVGGHQEVDDPAVRVRGSEQARPARGRRRAGRTRRRGPVAEAPRRGDRPGRPGPRHARASAAARPADPTGIASGRGRRPRQRAVRSASSRASTTTTSCRAPRRGARRRSVAAATSAAPGRSRRRSDSGTGVTGSWPAGPGTGPPWTSSAVLDGSPHRRVGRADDGEGAGVLAPAGERPAHLLGDAAAHGRVDLEVEAGRAGRRRAR